MSLTKAFLILSIVGAYSVKAMDSAKPTACNLSLKLDSPALAELRKTKVFREQMGLIDELRDPRIFDFRREFDLKMDKNLWEPFVLPEGNDLAKISAELNGQFLSGFATFGEGSDFNEGMIGGQVIQVKKVGEEIWIELKGADDMIAGEMTTLSRFHYVHRLSPEKIK